MQLPCDTKVLPYSFYQRDTVLVAKELLGKMFIRHIGDTILSGIICETEAYCAENDPASHAFNGQTKRNKAMFGLAGQSYIYFIYGNHYCLNIVAKDTAAQAGGVLIRGMIPVDGIEHMKKQRRTADVRQLMNGPGKICQALHLNMHDNHIPVTQTGPLYLAEGYALADDDIEATSRIGISKANNKRWRFFIKKEHAVLTAKKYMDLTSA